MIIRGNKRGGKTSEIYDRESRLAELDLLAHWVNGLKGEGDCKRLLAEYIIRRTLTLTGNDDKSWIDTMRNNENK